MKKLFSIFCFLPIIAAAQNFHFSGRLGLANYLGDLKEKDITLSQAKLMGSLGVQYDLSEHITARTYLTLTSLHADDKKGNGAMQRRNLNFTSKIVDWELTGQYSFFNLNEHWWTPYIFAGIGIYHFNPFTKDTGSKKYFLQPLSTEGEGFMPGVKNYKLTQFSVPIGFGAEYSLNEDTRIGLEFGYRKIFTDYLDDVSNVYVDQASLLGARGAKAVELAYRGNEVQAGSYPAAGIGRGNPNNKDGYYYIAVTYTIRYFFDKYKQIAGIAKFKKDKKVGCPATRQY
jgi:Outer membrane protein beta-barrel domain